MSNKQKQLMLSLLSLISFVFIIGSVWVSNQTVIRGWGLLPVEIKESASHGHEAGTAGDKGESWGFLRYLTWGTRTSIAIHYEIWPVLLPVYNHRTRVQMQKLLPVETIPDC